MKQKQFLFYRHSRVGHQSGPATAEKPTYLFGANQIITQGTPITVVKFESTSDGGVSWIEECTITLTDGLDAQTLDPIVTSGSVLRATLVSQSNGTSLVSAWVI